MYPRFLHDGKEKNVFLNYLTFDTTLKYKNPRRILLKKNGKTNKLRISSSRKKTQNMKKFNKVDETFNNNVESKKKGKIFGFLYVKKQKTSSWLSQ